VEEFFDWDDGTDTRYELVTGIPVAKDLPSLNHGELAVAIAAETRARLKPPCRVFAEAGIRLPNRDDVFFQADLAIACGPRTPDGRYLTDPMILFEILSPSTMSHDRGIKASEYRSIPSVREIVLLHSTAVKAEVWRRTDLGWMIEDLEGGDAVLRLTAVGIDLPLAVLYRGIDIEAA